MPAAVLSVAGLVACCLVASLTLARPGADATSGAAAWERRLQIAATSAEDTAPTLDKVDFVVFSRPPYSRQEQSELVYYSMASIYVLCAVVMLIGFNLDQAEKRRRIARSIVPHELEPYQLCCFRFMAHKESVPCEITEQYYLDARLLHLQTAQNIAERRLRMNLWQYVFGYGSNFIEVLTRKHLCLSFLLRAIPTFTRVKRALLIIVEFNICMATAAVAINVREHTAPQGKYELFTCSGTDSDCFATVPMALIAGAIMCPVFRIIIVSQMRLTCFVAQTHPSSSRFPLGARKFASLAPRSLFENLCCMRSRHERHKENVTKSRSLVHRAVQQLWRTTRPSVNDLRFYSLTTSWLILSLAIIFIAGVVAYMFEITAYLKDAVVYHWLAWTLVMFFFDLIVLEPLFIFWTDVVWCALVANVAQYWGFGSHALAATTRYKEIVRQVEELYLSGMRDVASMRIQRWWLAVLDMYRAIHEQTAAAIKIQAIRKKMSQKRKYSKDRKWCLKVEVLYGSDLEQANNSTQLISPLVRLMCDTGNPNVLQTKVAWESGDSPTYNETFFVDIKESNAMYVSVWTKDLISEEFLGRGYFEFNDLKSSDKDVPEGQLFNVPLYQIQHGERIMKNARHNSGQVSLRVWFLDPLKEECGNGGEQDWMLPKNRMKFALSKMNPGGRLKVGKMLGFMQPTPKAATTGGEAGGFDPAARSSGPSFPPPINASVAEAPGSAGVQGSAAGDGKAPASEIGDANVMEEFEGAKLNRRGSHVSSVAEAQGMPDLLRTRTGVMRSSGESFFPGGGSTSGGLSPPHTAGAAGRPTSGPLSGQPRLGSAPRGPPPTGPGQQGAGGAHLQDPASQRHDQPMLSLTPSQAGDGGAQNESVAPSMPGAIDSPAASPRGSRPLGPAGAGVGDF